jgi:hypothetical protein
MIKTSLKLAAMGLLAAVITALPLPTNAQSTNKAAADKSSAEKKAAPAKTDSSEKKKGGGVHGKLAAVDKTAKTITVGKHSYQVTSETRIFKADKPATLDDGVIGEQVSLGYKPGADGKLMATKITFGPKPESSDKKPAAEKENKDKAPPDQAPGDPAKK